MAHCKAITARGLACKAEAQAGSDLCFFHNPRSRGARRAAQSKGGRKKSRPPTGLTLPKFDLSKPPEILKLLSVAASLTLAAQLNPKAGNTIVGLCDAALRTLNVIGVIEEIKRLKQEQQAEKDLPFDPTQYLAPGFEEEPDASGEGQTEHKLAEHVLVDLLKQEKPGEKGGKGGDQ